MPFPIVHQLLRPFGNSFAAAGQDPLQYFIILRAGKFDANAIVNIMVEMLVSHILANSSELGYLPEAIAASILKIRGSALFGSDNLDGCFSVFIPILYHISLSEDARVRKNYQNFSIYINKLS
jgi:hypothetical protein